MAELSTFNFYRETAEMLNVLDDAELVGKIVLKVFRAGGMDGGAPELSKIEDFAYQSVMSQVERYDAKRQSKAANGRTGGRPSANQTETAEEPDHNLTESTNTITNTNTNTTISTNTDNGDTPLAPLGDVLASYDFSEEVRGALDDWLRYKRERREGYKPTGLKTLLGQVEGKQGELTGKEIVRAISESMASNYRGIVWDKAKERSGPPGRPAKPSHGHNPEDYDTPYERSMATYVSKGL